MHGENTLDKSLAKAGFHRDDITDMFLTHLHFDHCGGSITRQGENLIPAFKNASFWSNQEHWDCAIYPNEREKASFLKENILPIKESGKLKFIEPKEGVQFTKTIKIRFVNGHTESMMLPEIKYKDKTIVYMADLLPSVAHIPIPYVMAYDTRPLETLLEKKTFLTEAQEKDFVLFFEHDPEIECCNLEQTIKGIRSKETFKLESL